MPSDLRRSNDSLLLDAAGRRRRMHAAEHAAAAAARREGSQTARGADDAGGQASSAGVAAGRGRRVPALPRRSSDTASGGAAAAAAAAAARRHRDFLAAQLERVRSAAGEGGGDLGGVLDAHAAHLGAGALHRYEAARRGLGGRVLPTIASAVGDTSPANDYDGAAGEYAFTPAPGGGGGGGASAYSSGGPTLSPIQLPDADGTAEVVEEEEDEKEMVAVAAAADGASAAVPRGADAAAVWTTVDIESVRRLAANVAVAAISRALPRAPPPARLPAHASVAVATPAGIPREAIEGALAERSPAVAVVASPGGGTMMAAIPVEIPRTAAAAAAHAAAASDAVASDEPAAASAPFSPDELVEDPFQ